MTLPARCARIPPTKALATPTSKVLELLERLNETMPIVMVSHDVHMVSAHLKGAVCVNRTLERYAASEVSPEIIEKMYHGHSGATRGGGAPAT